MSAAVEPADATGVAILNRILELAKEPLTPEAARPLLALKFPRSDERRMNRLAAKARRGTLTDAERFEAEQYNMVGHLLALLKARAQSALQRTGEISHRS